MALLDQAMLAQHAGFRDRVLVAAMKSAVDISSEPASADARKDSMRKTLATNVLNGPAAHVDRFSWAVVQNANITYVSNDADIQFTVNSVWNGIAGV